MDGKTQREIVSGSGEVDYFDGLPEDCIGKTLSLTSPKDACRLSCVSPVFKSAADSDAVWERFLPSDYRTLVASTNFSSKKELYLRFADHPVLIDDGKKSFSLEKQSGKKCFMLSARSLTIVWGSTPQYWEWISIPESRFPEVAELVDVCWLEIRGRISNRILSPNTNYSAYLVYKFKTTAYGFMFLPVDVSVGIVEGSEPQNRVVYLDTAGQREKHGFHYFYGLHQNMMGSEVPLHAVERRDGWLEVELGHFYNGGDENGEVEISIKEIEDLFWKRGIIVEGIEIRPKSGE